MPWRPPELVMPASPVAPDVAVDAVPPVFAGTAFQPQLSLALQVVCVVNVAQSAGVPTHASVVPHSQL